KKILCFGGGSAMTKAVLEPLKKYPLDISSVTSMTDDGGSTGQLRQDFGILPPGDIRRHILALSDAPEWKKKIWTFRFGHDVFACGHKGHNFANVFLAGLEVGLKDYKKVLDVAHEFMKVKGRALPATIERIQLCAELEDGVIIKGESEIAVPKKHNPLVKIKQVFLEPKAKAYPLAILAIKKADALIIGPGDLYSSSIPCFLPEGMREAVKKTKAKKILVCNLMTKHGETNGFSVLDFAKETEKYIGCALDFVIYNTEIPQKSRIAENRKTDPLVIEPVKIDGVIDSKKFIGKNVITEKGPILHDPEKLGKLIYLLMQ
ncbi:MAG: YvcK family protein, partial [Nanoarchaeota archaeon]|nr:YvcK family protein [Nanoarchaeota archaeon]